MRHCNAVPAQLCGGADAREHQQLRRVEGSAAQGHFEPRADDLHHIAAPHFHAHRAPAFQHHAQRLGLGAYMQIGALLHYRMQIGRGGRTALAVLRAAMELRDLVVANAFLLRAVEVLVAFQAGLDAGLDECLGDRARAALLRDLQRAAAAMPFALAALVAFGALEVGQHLLEAPATAAGARPVVVVAAVAAHVEHGVDGAGAAQAAASRLVAAPAVQAGLGHGLVAVVVDLQGPTRQHGHHAGRRPHQDAPTVAAGLDQADRDTRVFTQARRQSGAARAAADDDVVELHAQSPRALMREARDCKELKSEGRRVFSLAGARSAFSSES